MSQQEFQHCIIGSGPTAIACLKGLIDSGASNIVVVDIGNELETRSAQKQEELKKQHHLYNENNKNNLLNQSQTIKGLKPPKKLLFGSDFAYRNIQNHFSFQKDVSCEISNAKGGFSNVWGASVLPLAHTDYLNWPVSEKMLRVHYEAVAELLELPSYNDDLSVDFFDYSKRGYANQRTNSRLATSLIKHLTRNKNYLKKIGFIFGKARLAINKNCKNSSYCLIGCPNNAIFNSVNYLNEQLNKKRIIYYQNCYVKKIEEDSNSVKIYCHSTRDNTIKTIHSHRIYIACGTVATAQLILNSFSKCISEINIGYHPYFILPGLTLSSEKNSSYNNSTTLAQIFLELTDNKISENRIHLQIYTGNQILEDKINRLCSKLPLIGAHLNFFLKNRLIFIQGYLHSSDTNKIQAKSHNKRVQFTGKLSKKAKNIINKLTFKLFLHAKKLGFVPLWPLLYIGKPGEGHHLGASLPMGTLTDYLGRLNNSKRIHIVDASILPFLPSSTITYTAMAHAHYIAQSACNLEETQ